MNRIFLIGNLTADPQSATTPNGTNLCRFDIAVERRGKDKDGKNIVDFWKIAVFNEKTADVCMKWLQKGAKVFVEGESQPYISESNGKHYLNNNVVASDIKFLSPKKEEEHKQIKLEDVPDYSGIDIPF